MRAGAPARLTLHLDPAVTSPAPINASRTAEQTWRGCVGCCLTWLGNLWEKQLCIFVPKPLHKYITHVCHMVSSCSGSFSQFKLQCNPLVKLLCGWIFTILMSIVQSLLPSVYTRWKQVTLNSSWGDGFVWVTPATVQTTPTTWSLTMTVGPQMLALQCLVVWDIGSNIVADRPH